MHQTFLFIALSGLLLLGVTAVMLFSAIHSDQERVAGAKILGSRALEIIWMMTPTIIILTIFLVGWK